MADRDILNYAPIVLRPDPSRTVIRPFEPSDPEPFADAAKPRIRRIAERVLALSDAALDEEMVRVVDSLAARHRDLDDLLQRRFDELKSELALGEVSKRQAELIGAYLSEEYSFESAALFNPSILLSPEQEGAPGGGVNFILSLRGIGEGHVSSVTFRTGCWTPGGDVIVHPPSERATPPRIEQDSDDREAPIRLVCDGAQDPSEIVLFPVAPRHRQGIEDVRFVGFTQDDGTLSYYATFTAFSGSEARCELLIADDFGEFTMQPLSGSAAATKGMALFPRKVNGRYAMLARQDNENIWLLTSDDLFHWEGGAKLVEPHASWEFVQMGNCGSPIEIDEGWLVLTHGVGAARNYCMGACLLDKDDPSKLLARTPRPIIQPRPDERNGYVPNVVYSCGSLLHGRDLLIPYGVADSLTKFASVTVDDLLAVMERCDRT